MSQKGLKRLIQFFIDGNKTAEVLDADLDVVPIPQVGKIAAYLFV